MRYYFILAISLLAQNIDAKATSDSGHKTQVWSIPVYLEVEGEWKIRKVYSVDSRMMLLSEKGNRITIDYGSRLPHGAYCNMEEIIGISKLSDLSCTRSSHDTFFIDIADPNDSHFGVTVAFKRPNLPPFNQDTNGLELLRSLRYVGQLDAIRLVWVDLSKRIAKIEYENGKTRVSRLGDTVARDFGVLKAIDRSSIVIKTFIHEDSGNFVARDFRLYLNKN